MGGEHAGGNVGKTQHHKSALHLGAIYVRFSVVLFAHFPLLAGLHLPHLVHDIPLRDVMPGGDSHHEIATAGGRLPQHPAVLGQSTAPLRDWRLLEYQLGM